MYYVYQLSSKKYGIFYIGKGKGSRMYQHVSLAKGKSNRKNNNPHLYNRIIKILNDGEKIQYKKLFESDIEKKCLDKEKEYISDIGTFHKIEGIKRGPLLNLTAGGEGSSGYIHSSLSKKKISDSLKGKLKGRIFHKDSLKRMSLAKKGKPSGNKGISHLERLINVYGEKEGHKKYFLFLEKQRKSHLGKKMKGKVWNKGSSISEETRKKIQNSLLGKKHKMNIVKCPHCGLEGSGGNMTRYHFNNCKSLTKI